METRSQLVGQDENEYNDIYDAHVGAVPPPQAPLCSGTGCQGVPASPPVFATPASTTYNGVGNFAPAKKVTKPKKKSKATGKKKGCAGKKARRKGGKAAERSKHAGKAAQNCPRGKKRSRSKHAGRTSRRHVRPANAKKGSAR